MLRKQDASIYGLLLLAIVILGYYFSIPMQFKIKSQNEILARVIGFTNSLKVKKSGTISWIDISGPRSLSLGDKLFTHENARARIKYIDGVEIELEPSTLIEISQNGDEAVIDIQLGYITLSVKDVKKRIRVQSKNEYVIIDTTKSKINVVQVNKGLSVNVRKGNAIVKKSSMRKTLKLTKGQVLTYDNKLVKAESVSASVRPSSIERIIRIIDDFPDTKLQSITGKHLKMIRPINNSKHYLYENKIELKFDWTGKTKKNSLIVSRYPDMSLSYIETEANLVRPISLKFNALGIYYWRIGNSKSQSFSIIRNPPIEEVTFESSLALRNLSKDREVYRIEWAPVKYAKSYLLEVFDDAEGRTLRASRSVLKNWILWKADLVDSLYYRVTAIDRWGTYGKKSRMGKLISPISPFENNSKK